MRISAIQCRTNTGEIAEVPVAEILQVLSGGGTSLGNGLVPKSNGSQYIASGISVDENGQIKFDGYGSERAFTGIATGLIGFTNDGRLITLPLQQTSNGGKISAPSQISTTTLSSTKNVLPYFSDTLGSLADTDILNDNGNYSFGGSSAFWKIDVNSGSVNIDQRSTTALGVSDGYRMNGKLVLSFDPVSGELTIGNTTYKTTNIQYLKTDTIQFNTSASATTMAPGLLRWNDTDGTLEFGMKGGNVTQQIGQELPILVKHADNAGLTNGAVVYSVGSDGSNKTVRLAKADAESTSSNTFGVMTESATGGNKAFCTTFGLVRDLNTSALTEGSAVYLSPSVAGGMTSTKPSAPNHMVLVGFCIRSHTTQGVIFVKIQNGFELNEIHDVAIGTLANNNLLAYESATSLWKNKTYAELGLLTSNEAWIQGGNTVTSQKAFGTTSGDFDIPIVRNGTTIATIKSIGLQLDVLQAETTDVDRFLVSNNGQVKFRTGTQLLSDIGAFPTPTGLTTGYITQWNGVSLSNSSIFNNGTGINIGMTNGLNTLNLNKSVISSGYGAGISLFTGVDGGIYSSGIYAKQYDYAYQIGLSFVTLDFLGQGGQFEAMTIKYNGNVGIGTTNPTYLLTVNGVLNIGAGPSNLGVLISNTISTLPTSSIQSQIGSLNSGLGFSAGSLYLQPRTGVSASIVFGTEGSSKMVVSSTGNVGIGTTTPNDRLDVVGTGHFTGAVLFDTVPSTPVAPTSGNHLVNLNYLNSVTFLKRGETVRTISLTTLTKSGLYTVNGYALQAGDLVLDAGGTSGGGVWVAAAGAWSRSTLNDSDPEIRGAYHYITHGTFANQRYINTNTSAISLNTTAITYGIDFGAEVDPVFTSWRDTSRGANMVFAAGTGSGAGVGTWRNLVAADIPILNQNTTGSAATLTTARNIAMTGDVAWNVNFNGSANVTAIGTLATVTDSGVGAFLKITRNSKGLVTGTQAVTTGDITDLLDAYTKTESDARFVHLEGDENIDGVKTFLTDIKVSNNQIHLAEDFLNRGGSPASYGVVSNKLGAGGLILDVLSAAGLYFRTDTTRKALFDTNGLILSNSLGNSDVPTERLHVVGNIRYSGTLKPNNAQGTAGQFLKNNGVGNVDTWATIGHADITNLATFTGFDGRYFTETESDARYQPLDADLTAIAGLTVTSGILTKTAANTWALDTNVYMYSGNLTTFKATTSQLGVVSVGTTMEINGFGVINQKSGIVTAGTYTKVTVDTYGRVTSGAILSASDIPNLDASKITTGTIADARIASASTWNAKQEALNGTGFIKATGTTISYDNREFVDTTTAQSNIAGNKTFTGITTLANFTRIGGSYGVRLNSGQTYNGKTNVNTYFNGDISVGVYAQMKLDASDFMFSKGNVKIGGAYSGTIGTIEWATEKLDIDGNLRLSGVIKPDNLAPTAGQFLKGVDADNMTWASLSCADVTDIGSIYQPILPTGTAGQFLVRNASNNLDFMNLELEPQGLSYNKIAVGDSANYLSEYDNFEFREGRYVAIFKNADPTKAFYAGMYATSNNSYVTASGGALVLKADNGIYLDGFTGFGNKMLYVDGDGKVGYTDIPSGGGGGSTSLTSQYIGFGSPTNLVTGVSRFKWVDNRIINIDNAGSSNIEIGRKLGTDNYGLFVNNGDLELYTNQNINAYIGATGQFKIGDKLKYFRNTNSIQLDSIYTAGEYLTIGNPVGDVFWMNAINAKLSLSGTELALGSTETSYMTFQNARINWDTSYCVNGWSSGSSPQEGDEVTLIFSGGEFKLKRKI